ncbi:MAG: hypothetical protein H0T92_11025 [Pyrinomonadaceae bacterium]|nr:hypothetical protein [Pyrinomonadaceae bacterium]
MRRTNKLPRVLHPAPRIVADEGVPSVGLTKRRYGEEACAIPSRKRPVLMRFAVSRDLMQILQSSFNTEFTEAGEFTEMLFSARPLCSLRPLW